MSMLFITYHYYFLFSEEAEQPRKRIPFELIKMIRVVIKCNPAGIYLANFDQTFKVNCLLVLLLNSTVCIFLFHSLFDVN